MSSVSNKKIAYFNVNYKCDNKCVFCFSNHINNSIETNISYSQFLECINTIEHIDRIIINGGEPLFNPDIFRIINYSKKVSKEVVLYSNGNAFSNIEKAIEIVNTGIDRITIPIHGNQALHSYITRNPKSYENVISGLLNFRKHDFLNKIEAKFIITNKMVEEKFDISAFLKNFPEIDNIVICGQVNTDVSCISNQNVRADSSYYNYVNYQLINLIGNYDIKIYDFELCKLNNHIKSLFTNIVNNQSTSFDFYFFDINHLKKCVIPYNSNRKMIKCQNCLYRDFCTEILNKYMILKITKKLYCEVSFE